MDHIFVNKLRGSVQVSFFFHLHRTAKLHRPLNVASYYLNPMMHYNPKFYQVKCGMYNCLDRLGGDIDEISKVDAQIESFKSKSRFFLVV